MEQVAAIPHIPLWLDLAAVAFGAVSASATAEGLQLRGRRIDWLGVVILGIAVGLGGGFMRDLLLGLAPATIQSNWYVFTAGLAALMGMWLSNVLRRVDTLVTVLDAASLGTFAVVGTAKAITYGLDPLPAIMIGTVAAAGGGAVRDLLLQLPVGVLYAGTFYAAAALLGASAFVVLDLFHVPVFVGMIVCFVVTFLVRMASVWWGLSLPEQMALRLPSGRRRRETRVLLSWRARRERRNQRRRTSGGGAQPGQLPIAGFVHDDEPRDER